MKARYGFQFGTLEIEYEGDVLKALRCVPTEGEVADPETDERSAFSDLVEKQVQEYLAGERRSFDIKYELEGTDFQKKVWNALTQIPYGETRSYKEVAEMIGNSKASRAVGMANNRNPLMMIIPCHRVIGADGSLTGYAGGLEMKHYLLELERNN